VGGSGDRRCKCSERERESGGIETVRLLLCVLGREGAWMLHIVSTQPRGEKIIWKYLLAGDGSMPVETCENIDFTSGLTLY
jgi:hypothetical protein